MAETHPNRTVFRISGEDREDFLQGLVTSDVADLAGLTYAALLTPQGKFIADFFLMPEADAILLDVDTSLARELLLKLKMYKLRAKAEIEETDLYAIRGIGDAPEGAAPDPRHPALGWRLYRAEPGDARAIDWDAIRVEHCIPATGTELGPDTFILEAGFDRMRGVDFRKGCYVGQEVTARMRHKTELRKGFVTVVLDGEAVAGTPLTSEDGKQAGHLCTVAGDKAIAYVRFDRAKGPMSAGDARAIWAG